MRLTVAEAAERLGVTAEAVRQRIKRNTLAHEKDGRKVYVLLDPDRTRHDGRHDGDRSFDNSLNPLVVASLRDQVEMLRGELDDWKEAARRKDAIIMQMTQSIPALLPPIPPEARPGAPEARESAEEPLGKGEPPAEAQAGSQRPWWRRLFSAT